MPRSTGLSGLFDPERLYNALKDADMLPVWQQYSPGGDTLGQYVRENNTITSPDIGNNPIRYETMSHEMAHAVQQNLLKNMAHAIADRKYNKDTISDQENQYLKTASTFFNTHYGPMGLYNRREVEKNKESLSSLIAGLYKGPSEYKDYRTSPTEAQAWGVGNLSTPYSDTGTNRQPHLDSTMATEFDILLSMYQNLPKAVKEKAEEARRREIKPSSGNKTYSSPFGFRFK